MFPVKENSKVMVRPGHKVGERNNLKAQNEGCLAAPRSDAYGVFKEGVLVLKDTEIS